MAVQLATAISAVNKACERMDRSPAIRPPGDIRPNFLNKIKGFLINDGFLGILKYLPKISIHIMTMCILEMLPGLEIHGMTEIFPALKDRYDHRT